MTSEEEITDTELVTLARSGDKNAFGRLAERYQQMARRVAACMVSDEDMARELTQEAMLQAYLSLSHLRDDAAFGNWLYGIVLNVCRSYLRDQKTVLSWEDLEGGVRFGVLDFSDAAPDPQWAAEEQELHRKVLQAVQNLPPASQVAALLFYYERLSLQEIAAILGISVTAVKGRLYKARKRLGEQLSALYSDGETSPYEVQEGNNGQGHNR
jgi:RNA polymerase sigma factor (sigma-70 family)